MSRAVENEYVLYCDESVQEGAFYSNFYGGVLIGASMLETVSRRLNDQKRALHFHNEVKWQKVTDNYLEKYRSLMDAFFDELQAGRIKVRQSALRPTGLTPEQLDETYFKLYYQFIKHAFGFSEFPDRDNPTRLRMYFDQFPDTGEQVARFRGYIFGLNDSRAFRDAKLFTQHDCIVEVRSHEHVLLQCLDIVLGAMAFRLNNLHKVIPEGERRRGKRTIAKEKLYKHIHARICLMHPRFNIGITTGGGKASAWSRPYAHWAFVPKAYDFDESRTKGKK
jgi:hypothetical protein